MVSPGAPRFAAVAGMLAAAGAVIALAVLAAVAYGPVACTPMPERAAYPEDFGVRRLVIDAGHGGENEGTKTAWWEFEKNRNLRLAKALANFLRESGHWDVKLTRERDVDLPNSERPEIANAYEADVYLSLHGNGHLRPRRGFGIIWYSAQEIPESRELAVTIARRLEAAGFPPDRTMGPVFKERDDPERTPDYQLTEPDLPVYVRQKSDHKMIYPARMPAVLIETHYLTDLVEAVRFTSEAARRRLFTALEAGLVDFLGAHPDRRYPWAAPLKKDEISQNVQKITE
ncbi:MAG: N-acetylmuramoyl-L-alanine amidase [Deltaproteobacteria bacterium]|nr:N-acetylmuramoyl-L-alanine amidase [Deltaproteobacteria bacterium]